MTQQRNRAEGWQYAKLSGHKNENLVKLRIEEDSDFKASLLARLDNLNKNIKMVCIGGLHETNVESIIPHAPKTKSKTDLRLYYTDQSYNNISIKKSLGGQVYLVSTEIFIKNFELQFHKQIPEQVKQAINLFWSAADNADEIINIYADKTTVKGYNLQKRHHSVNAQTLFNYDISLYNILLQWFKENIYEICLLAFATGAAKNCIDWSDHIWYINCLHENPVDELFNIRDLCAACQQCANEEIYYGTTNGGTTIQLPFGFVQWHQAKMQFHHKYEKIKQLLAF